MKTKPQVISRGEDKQPSTRPDAPRHLPGAAAGSGRVLLARQPRAARELPAHPTAPCSGAWPAQAPAEFTRVLGSPHVSCGFRSGSAAQARRQLGTGGGCGGEAELLGLVAARAWWPTTVLCSEVLGTDVLGARPASAGPQGEALPGGSGGAISSPLLEEPGPRGWGGRRPELGQGCHAGAGRSGQVGPGQACSPCPLSQAQLTQVTTACRQGGGCHVGRGRSPAAVGGTHVTGGFPIASEVCEQR